MYVKHEVRMDLTKRGNTPTIIDVVREDTSSRRIDFILRTGFDLWCPPADAAVVIRYRKEDGTGGEYDTMPDGTVAYEIRECTVSVLLAPQVLVTEGNVDLSVTLVHGMSQLNTFLVKLNVTGKVPELAESADYFNITGFIPQPETAAVGQYLEVSEVDENGKVRAVRAMNASVEQLQHNAIATTLRENMGTLPNNLLQVPLKEKTRVGDGFEMTDEGTVKCLYDGFVLSTATVMLSTSSSSVYVGVYINKNGSDVETHYSWLGGSYGCVGMPAKLFPVSAGDIISLGIHASGATVNTSSRTQLMLVYV